MEECERCGEEVEELTKTTGTCPKCAKDEVEHGHWCLDNTDDPELAGEVAKAITITEKTLTKEGY